MSEWTLAKELQQRGITPEEAAHRTGLDGVTLGYLLAGYQTLPQFALMVGKGLGLTQEQTRTLGKPLDRRIWLREGYPKPSKVDIDPLWYKTIRSADPGEEAPPVWLDIGAAALWLWSHGKDPEIIASCNGSTIGKVNRLAKHNLRMTRIIQLEAQYGLPPEAVETTEDLTRAVFSVRYLLNAAHVRAVMRRDALTPTWMTRRWMQETGSRVQASKALERMREILTMMDAGEPVTREQADKVAMGIMEPVREVAMPVVLRTLLGETRKHEQEGEP